MTSYQNPAPTTIEIVEAQKEHESILANLLELYIYDFSEILELPLGADGRFGYERLPLYWQEPGRHPFLIKVNGHLAGFALVRRGSQVSEDAEVWDMAEFFVVRGLRRLGVGMQAAHEIWRKFPGKWEVRVMQKNQKALKFWERAVNEFIDKPSPPLAYEKPDKGWQVFSFESKRQG